MKQRIMAALMVLAMAGFCGCDEEEETGSDAGSDFYSGTWNGTMAGGYGSCSCKLFRIYIPYKT